MEQRTIRICAAVLLCAVMLRLYSTGWQEQVEEILSQPNIAAFLIYLETGRDVRFSPSSQAFSPGFVETPPPLLPETTEPTEPELPSFSDPEVVNVYYACPVEPDLASLLAQPLNWSLKGEEPAVLILHTHSTESYTRAGEDYRETSSWRTLDENYNMLSVGQRVAQLLEENGIAVVQDRSLHDYPSYNGSYVDARKSIREYLEEYPSVKLVLDLHRDALENENGQIRTWATVDGQTSAQLMLVVGTNHEAYEENLSLALKLHAQLETASPGLMRPLQLRGQRFNQDLSTGALLIEVGTAGNTHREAMVAAEALAAGIIALAGGTE